MRHSELLRLLAGVSQKMLTPASNPPAAAGHDGNALAAAGMRDGGWCSDQPV
jgi:hypothetical protein